MSEGELGMTDIGDTLLDAIIGADHDFKSIDMPGATGQEPYNSVEVSTEIDVQQEPQDEGCAMKLYFEFPKHIRNLMDPEDTSIKMLVNAHGYVINNIMTF